MNFIPIDDLIILSSVRDFDEKTRQKETLKAPKKLLIDLPLITASFIIKVEQIVLLKGSRG